MTKMSLLAVRMFSLSFKLKQAKFLFLSFLPTEMVVKEELQPTTGWQPTAGQCSSCSKKMYRQNRNLLACLNVYRTGRLAVAVAKMCVFLISTGQS